MSCGSCIDKLAYRLMDNHKIDMIRAYELAEKGLERHERNEVASLTEKEKAALSFDPDYSQACNACPAGSCSVGDVCFAISDCRVCPPTTCPAPSKPNSHYVSKTCACTPSSGCTCAGTPVKKCDGTVPACTKSGLCYYVCDVGYVWNPVTLQCEKPVVPSGGAHGNFALAVFSVLSVWWHRRRRRKFIGTLK